MTRSSEWVSLGHPDKIADYIACFILDRYLEEDPLTRYAVEVLIKDRRVFLAGEVSSRARFSYKDLESFVQTAVLQIGYDRAYEDAWGVSNGVCGDDLHVQAEISAQSPDIARGVDAEGWGDQGIFWGMAVDDPAREFLPADYWLARELGRGLYFDAFGGLDVKTLVTVDEAGDPVQVVAAVPVHGQAESAVVERRLRAMLPDPSVPLVLNGTGAFRVHGPVGDSGVTGRKLACDFYGGNCRLGGGSPWGKDPTKADVTLNVVARRLALQAVRRFGLPVAYCALACCIGRREVRVEIMDGGLRPIESYVLDRPAAYFIEQNDLRLPRYCDLCRYGLFSGIGAP